MSDPTERQRVAVVTGGAGGIGGAIAESLGAEGIHVVTVDPEVSVDGLERLAASEETTADRIIAAGGSAQTSAVSVTESAAVDGLFADLADRHGGVDFVVNVAGISRPTSYVAGAESDWSDVIDVHLNGYINILRAALHVMAPVGAGRILGVTSGSGWRAADTGAYGCAKRAVASITWQLGRTAPSGITVNALSPIAATRMVTSALAASRPKTSGEATAGAGTGGLSLGRMPKASDLGPVGAWLASHDQLSWCNGQVLFSGGDELAVIEQPSLVEVVRTSDARAISHVLRTVTAKALVPAEQRQATNGGSNSRFDSIFDELDESDPAAADAETSVRTCALFVADPEVAASVEASLLARGVVCTAIPGGADATTFAASTSALDQVGDVDAVIVAPSAASDGAGDDADWRSDLADHAGLAATIVGDAGWARACAALAVARDRPLRLLQLIPAATAAGRSRAQAATQLSRAAWRATDERVAHFVVSIEPATDAEADERLEIGAAAGHLLCEPDATALSGAELVLRPGWLGLRRHPKPAGSIVFGGPTVPAWMNTALREVIHPTAVDRADAQDREPAR